MKIEDIIKTMALLGADLPAYKALLDEVIDLFHSHDQDKLKQSYAEAIAASDAAHKDAQEV